MADVPTIKTAFEWFQILGLGAALGAIGQGARAIVGLKKVNDTASAPGSVQTATDMFQASQLLVSLMIGAIAGALTATTIGVDLQKVPLSLLMGLAAAGYSGSDLIEGLMKRFLPQGDAAGTTATTTTTTTSPASDGAEG